MLHTQDFSDSRLKTWCIHCGDEIFGKPSNRDHVPTKSLLSRPVRRLGAEYDKGVGDPLDYLPQVEICKSCNSSFSADETYLLCVLHAVMSGTLYPDPATQAEAYNVLRSNRNIVRELKCGWGGQMWLFDDLTPFTVYPDPDRIARVIVKNARGHVRHELAEGASGPPIHSSFMPINLLSDAERSDFENARQGEMRVWPEVGSRMMERIMTGSDMEGGWIVVEPDRYRFCIDWHECISVKTVIWEYLATETRWPR